MGYADADRGDYTGLWQRLLLSTPDNPIDTLTRVDWIQGPELYVDLRQPPDLAGAVAATCLSQLQPCEAMVLARQEGFAGRFVVADNAAEWQREIDFRPCPLGDRGRLQSHGDLLVEHGIEADYIEHWQREPASLSGASGSALFRSERDGRLVILVRQGNRFGYARNRMWPVGRHETLSSLLREATPEEARELIDCEISLGTVTRQGWRIDRSSLPWRKGAILLDASARMDGGRLVMADVDALGVPIVRSLKLLESHGDLSFPVLSPASLSAGHDSPGLVPVIDISQLGCGDEQAEAEVVANLGRAAREIGFLHITGHGIAPAVIARMQAAAKAFFALPLDDKLASYIGHSGNHRGYVPEGEESFAGAKHDRKEAFDLALDLPAECVPAGHPMLGPNQWPALPCFREDVMAYYAAAFAVGRRLLRGFALAAGQSGDCLERLVVTPPSQLRLLHYPFQADAVDVAGIGAHTDYECFTLLLAMGPGLEVMDQQGEWADAPPVPGGLVVNIGDMLEYWSGGEFVATSHRVRKVAHERYSFPLFFALDYDVELGIAGNPDSDTIRTGEHLFAQTAQTFRYLKERVARGEVVLPGSSRPLASFGQEARHRQRSAITQEN